MSLGSRWFFIILFALASVKATAQIRADAAAPSDQRPTILQAGNGVPLVNIQTPSAAGVSRNSYSQFDVDRNGTILNNSRTDTQTQLGGWVQGNPWLATGSARVILNEVNSSNPSHLNGWIEVAGKPAQVITANPAGITCNGCGFINTPQVTLATGTPVLNQGNLDGYRIQGGHVQIEGLGLDGRQVDALTILTRAAEINAALWANRLNIVTGTNDVSVDANGQPTQIAPIIISPVPRKFSGDISDSQTTDKTAPVFALDVSYLGGMYAGHIFLVGSEHGLGVPNAGALFAAQQLTLDSNGILSVKDEGKITAPELAIKTEGAIDNSGVITAQRSATIETNSTLRNTGTIASQQTLSITAQQLTNTSTSTTASRNSTASRTTNVNTTNKSSSTTTNNTITSDGLIDGQTVIINSARIENLVAARLYGDHLVLQADTLINSGETMNDISRSPVIAARNAMTLGVGTLENRERGLILSGGDLTVGRHIQTTLDPTTGQTRYATTGFATRISNDSSTIDVLGDVLMQAIALANRNNHLRIDPVPEAPFSVQRVQPVRSNSMYLASQCSNLGTSGFVNCSAEGRQESFEDYTWYTLTGSPIRSQVVRSQPAVFRVGGNFNFNGGSSTSSQLSNQDSQIIIGRDIRLNNTTLNNQETKGTYSTQYKGNAQYTTVEYCGGPFGSHCRKWHGTFTYNSAPEVTTIDLPTGQRYVANTTQTSNNPLNNPPVQIPPLPGSANGTNSALFTLQPNPESTGGYLIETDPRFANYRQWQSSDYLLDQLAVDPATTQKRLGDGYYEQSLIRDQVAHITGRRFLPGYTDDEIQFLALMNNATTVAKDLQLRPGIALSAEQVALLTSDIVWLVEQDVTLPDGSTTRVLVPKVYARLKEGDLEADGTLISGRSITARLQGDLTNSGLITADQNVVVTAENIHNLKGSIEGRDVRLYAGGDINNAGGRIAATERLKLQAGRDLNVQSTTQTTETQLSQSEAARGNRFTRTQVDRVAGVYVTGSNTAEGTTAGDNTLNLTAGRNITLAAAQIQNTTAGTTTITAGEHLQITTVTTGQDDKAVKNANNFSHIAHREEVGTEISTTGALTLTAAQDLTLRVATVTSGGAIEVQAGNDLRIEAGQADSLNDQARKTTHRGMLSSTTTTTRDRFEDSTSLATTLSGRSINAIAAGDITVQGSAVVADKDIQLNAGRDLNITASTNTHAEDHYQQKTKSGAFGSGGAGVTIGKRTQSTGQQTTRTTSSASTVGSLDGNIDLQAGRTYTQTGSGVIALGQNNTNPPHQNQTTGDITITAKQVGITEARETSRTVIETQFKQTGITVAVSAPIITAAQTVEQMAQAAGNTSDPRMKALAAASAGMAINTAADAIEKNPDQLGGVNLSISLGSSKSQSNSTSTSDTGAPSQLVAANNLSITALTEDLTIQGSQLKAGNTVNLQAEKDLNLQAARDSAEQHSTNRNQSASIGVGFALGAQQSGVSLNLAASQGRGNADGSDVAWVNTEVVAGQQIQTSSGNDTTIRGGVITAPQVTIATGTSGNGNLAIESLQDTSQYKSQQKQHGATFSVPIAGGKPSGSVNATHSNIKSDYASVNQQSSIRAGDEGFQVNVQGDTTLIGGAITSTQTAVDQQKNSFRTEGTLTTSDIDNKAGYEATSVGVNLGVGYSASGNLAPQGTGVGLGSDSDSQRSTTQAAISDVAGNKAARTGDAEAGLVNRFDAERVQKEIAAQVQITQTFGQQAGKRISDYAETKRTLLQEQFKNSTDETERLAIQAEIHDLNMQERALNVMVGAVTGFGGVILLKEALSTGAEQMRQLMIDDSKKFKGVTDGKTVLSNVSGVSDGVRGDGVKVGGTRVDLDLLCGPVNERCEKNADGSLMIDENGYIVFKEGNIGEFFETSEGKKMIGPTGGIQGSKGKLFGMDYEAGSWQDRLIEAFSGTHDMIGGKLSGLYDEQGNIRREMSDLERNVYDKGVTTTAIVPSIPFSAAELLTPELWKAMSIFLKAAR